MNQIHLSESNFAAQNSKTKESKNRHRNAYLINKLIRIESILLFVNFCLSQNRFWLFFFVINKLSRFAHPPAIPSILGTTISSTCTNQPQPFTTFIIDISHSGANQAQLRRLRMSKHQNTYLIHCPVERLKTVNGGMK